jgi:hypothetical protein
MSEETAAKVTDVVPVPAPNSSDPHWVPPVTGKGAPPPHPGDSNHTAPDTRPWVKPDGTEFKPSAPTPAPTSALPPPSLAGVSPDVLMAALAAIHIPKMAHQEHASGAPPEGNRVQMAAGVDKAVANSRA